MKKSKLSTRDTILLVLLVIILIGAWYYMGFYTPLQEELNNLQGQVTSLDAQLLAASNKYKAMASMKAELEEILSRPENEITEIAPYDNKDVVFNELNGILYGTDYSLNFSDPQIQADGTVRRVVSMTFRCSNYKTAKNIITALAQNRWRCLVGNLAIDSGGDLMTDEVSVSVTITFFESTKLQANVENPETNK